METLPRNEEISSQPLSYTHDRQSKQIIVFPVKISDKITANLELKYPLEEEDLHEFLSTIEALKPGVLSSVLKKINDKGPCDFEK